MEELSVKDAYEIVMTTGKLIDEGIIINGNKLSFTMLDYYSLFGDSISKVWKLIASHWTPSSKQEYYYKSLFGSFLMIKRIIKEEVEDIKDVLNEKNAFIINGKRLEPTEDDIQYIFDVFENNNIPKVDRLIYTAIERYVKGYPILPLINNELDNDKQKVK